MPDYRLRYLTLTPSHIIIYKPITIVFLSHVLLDLGAAIFENISSRFFSLFAILCNKMETGKRTRISDNQRDILERFYGRGMVGVGLNYREMIESAVAETGLTTTQVKVNIPIIFFVLNSLNEVRILYLTISYII